MLRDRTYFKIWRINTIIPLRTNQKFIQTLLTTREAAAMICSCHRLNRIRNRKFHIEERASFSTFVWKLSAGGHYRKTQQKTVSSVTGLGNMLGFLQMGLG